MRVDRSRFLELTVLLTAGCGAAQSDPRASPATTVQLAPPLGAGADASPPPMVVVEAPDAAPAPASPPAKPALCNDSGDVHNACGRVSPTCEGLRDECESLTEDLRPKMAEAFAECMAKTKGRTCRSRDLGACFRAAIEAGCIDDEARTRCESLMADCKTHGKKPRYTLDQCAKVLSASTPDRPGEWRKVNEERLGYGPTSEACSLTYVLPYQPWGPSWR